MMKTRNLQLYVGLLIYLVGTTLFTLYSYFSQYEQRIKDVDTKLYMAAHATAIILGEDFHSQEFDNNSISPEMDFQIAMRLTDFVNETGIEYLYSAIKQGNDIFFTTSSATKEEIESNSYSPAYLTNYLEATQMLHEAFETSEVQFSEYKDRWGEHRSAFVPLTSGNGTAYVVGADVSLEEIKNLSQSSAISSAIACLFLAAIGFPLAFFYIKSINREAHLEAQRFYRCPLTGLPNRNQLIEDLKKSDCNSLAIFNIDKFRELTNVYGPAVGDDLLKQVAMRLQKIQGIKVSNVKPYRLNADEFALLTTGEHPIDVLETEVKEMGSYLTFRPFQAGSKQINLLIRIGAAANSKDVFTLADIALGETKELGKSLVIYRNDSNLPTSYKENLEKTQQFKLALNEERFIPYFQAIANAETGDIEKYECLARMVDNAGNIIEQPNDFLPVAHRSRLYHKFSQLMFKKIIKAASRNREVVSINLSISDINHNETRALICYILSKFTLCQLIEFEILEDENINDLETAKQFIRRLKSFGCRVGLDDMGKDYSNLDRLLKLPVDFVKIDGSIILALATSRDAQEITKTIIAFAKKRQLKVIAEYCCDENVTDVARSLGVDYLQGYYIGKPSPEFSKKRVNLNQNEQLMKTESF